MSWQDLIDESSLNQFVSGGGVEDETTDDEQQQDVAELLPAQNAGDELDVTIPPSVTTMYGTEWRNVSLIFDDDSDVDEDYSDCDCITIVSSVPSSTHINAMVPTTSHAVQNRAETTVSISTIEDSEESTSLTLHPDSIESSLMTNFTQSSSMNTSSVSSREQSESSDVSMESDSQVLREEKKDTTQKFSGNNSEASYSVKLPAASIEPSASTDDQLKLWYSHLKTEQDWEEFREAASELLKAIDCPVKNQDDLIAQLIAAEEDFFWESKTNSIVIAQTQPKSWLLEIVAVAATVALTSVALIKILKAR